MALLDVNVGEETSFDFARACRSEGIEVIFMTGYSRAILPEEIDTYDPYDEEVRVWQA